MHRARAICGASMDRYCHGPVTLSFRYRSAIDHSFFTRLERRVLFCRTRPYIWPLYFTGRYLIRPTSRYMRSTSAGLSSPYVRAADLLLFLFLRARASLFLSSIMSPTRVNQYNTAHTVIMLKNTMSNVNAFIIICF
jgi:hypothetical protein